MAQKEDFQENIQQILNENAQIIKVILRCQSEGRMMDCLLYQTRLQLNLIQLAALADNRPHPSIGTESNSEIFSNKEESDQQTDLGKFIRAVKENGMKDLLLISRITSIQSNKIRPICNAYIDYLKRKCRYTEAAKFEKDLEFYDSTETKERDNVEENKEDK